MLSADGCSVSGLSLIDQQYSFLGYYPDITINLESPLIPSIKKLIESDSISQLIKYSKEVCFVLEESRYVLVPNPLFDSEKIDLLFTTVNTKSDIELLEVSDINEVDHKVIFPINPFLKEYIDSLDFKTKIQSHVGLFISSSKKYADHEDFIHVRKTNRNLDICYFQKGELQFYNNFDYTSNEDATYYVAYAFEQFKLSQEKITLYLSGDIAKTDDWYSMIKQYIRTIEFLKKSSDFQYFFKLNLTDFHQFAIILN